MQNLYEHTNTWLSAGECRYGTVNQPAPLKSMTTEAGKPALDFSEPSPARIDYSVPHLLICNNLARAENHKYTNI